MRLGLALLQITIFAALGVFAAAGPETTPTLSSWNDGPAKTRIVAFVEDVTKPGRPHFIKPEDRIAVFDNDGTLWAEKPLYFQFIFAMDRVKDLAPQHPEWQTTQPFAAVLSNDLKMLAASGHKGIIDILLATHAGMTSDQFTAIAEKWLSTARHPRCDCPYTDLAYQPMTELLAYLRAKGFKTYIVTGGTVEFVRAFAERIYGVPPEQVIGSTLATQLVSNDGKLAIARDAKVEFVDDGPGKPVAINRIIGRRPVIAVGNSDGDQQMLEWSAASAGPSLEILIHHTDAVREWAYDRDSAVGRLDKALDEARARNWLVVDMKSDWRVVFAHPLPPARPD